MDPDILSCLGTTEPLLLVLYPLTVVDMGQYLSRTKEATNLERPWSEYVDELAREDWPQSASGRTGVRLCRPGRRDPKRAQGIRYAARPVTVPQRSGHSQFVPPSTAAPYCRWAIGNRDSSLVIAQNPPSAHPLGFIISDRRYRAKSQASCPARSLAVHRSFRTSRSTTTPK